jgi:hypothetical protein
MNEREFGYDDLERAALAFVLEDETWPVFDRWFRNNIHSMRMHEWMDAHDLLTVRRLWMLNSPDQDIRAAAEGAADSDPA